MRIIFSILVLLTSIGCKEETRIPPIFENKSEKIAKDIKAVNSKLEAIIKLHYVLQPSLDENKEHAQVGYNKLLAINTSHCVDDYSVQFRKVVSSAREMLVAINNVSDYDTKGSPSLNAVLEKKEFMTFALRDLKAISKKYIAAAQK